MMPRSAPVAHPSVQLAAEPTQGFANGPAAFVGERLVVRLDCRQVIEIVDHEARGLLQTLRRNVAEPAKSLEASAVAEVETGDRIDRPTLVVALSQKIIDAKRRQQLFQFRRR